MISKDTATDIALAYREIEAGEELLTKIGEEQSRGAPPDLRDAFGRPRSGFEFGVPSGNSGHRLFGVPWTLAKPIIEAHIAHHKSRIALLCEKAREELA